MYCFRFILQNMMKPLTHFFFGCVEQGAFLFLSFTGRPPARPLLPFLLAAGKVDARRVGVHVWSPSSSLADFRSTGLA